MCFGSIGFYPTICSIIFYKQLQNTQAKEILISTRIQCSGTIFLSHYFTF